jgi:hypothetical protein
MNKPKKIASQWQNSNLTKTLLIGSVIFTVGILTATVYAIFNHKDRSDNITGVPEKIEPTPTQSTTEIIRQPPTVDRDISKPSTSPNTIASIKAPPIVPDWAKKESKFQLPIHQSVWDDSKGISYQPDKKPTFQPSDRLTGIIKKVTNLIEGKKLSTNNLSIALIDANTNQIAEYHNGKPMFPASIAKMFWLVTLQGQIHANMWKNPEAFDPFIDRMMRESDNDSSSFIIDNITGSYSSQGKSTTDELERWLKGRQFRINEYFRASEYDININLTQKTYPIPYLNLSDPTGNELQIRANPTKPAEAIRNKLTTFDAARLMYEICYRKQAVSEIASKKMCSLLERKVDKKEWSKIKLEDFNPVESFFGESLPSNNVRFYSKAGWTPKSRSEVSLVEIIDKRKSYVLAVFADDPAFGKDKTIFPEISKLVYSEINSAIPK